MESERGGGVTYQGDGVYIWICMWMTHHILDVMIGLEVFHGNRNISIQGSRLTA